MTTVVLTELITNNAAAALMLPIALAAAAGIDARPFALAIAVAASASFLTPIGYQTNTMVYGPGGYRFGDLVVCPGSQRQIGERWIIAGGQYQDRHIAGHATRIDQRARAS